MRILEVTEEHIEFDNGMKITFDHEQDCCESNYADFEQLEEAALSVEFDDELKFEEVDEGGFRFGSSDDQMFFIPCYSEQNGYYTDAIDIYFNADKVLSPQCEDKYYY